MAGLSNKQRVFIEEYLQCWNGTEAARRAGYAQPHSQGPRLLENVGISEFIKARIADKAMTADEVLLRLAEQARGGIESFLVTSFRGDLERFDLGDDKPLHLIKKASVTESEFRGITKRTTTIELYDAQAALVHIGKHHGLFKDVLEIQIPWDDLTDEQLQRIAAGEDPKKVIASRER